MTKLLTFDIEDLDKPIVLKSPNWAVFSAWFDEAFQRAEKGDADHNLVIACASDPSAEKLVEIFDDGFGLLPTTLAEELVEAAGCPGGWTRVVMPDRLPFLSLKEAEETHTRAAKEEQKPEDERELVHVVPRELIDTAKAKTRRPFFVQHPNGSWWALKAPGSSEGARFQTESVKAMRGETSISNLGRTLLLKCVLSPSREIAEAEVDDLPGIVPRIVPSLREAAGEGKAVARVRA